MKGTLLAILTLFFPIYLQAQSSILSDTLVAYYPFNGNAMDSSGFENHGEVFGATLTEDRFGNPESAYSFDGNSDYIKVLDSDYLTPNNFRWSVSLWFKAGLSSLDRFLFYKGSTSSDREYAGGIASDSTISFQINEDGDALNRSGVRTPNHSKENIWQHYVGVWDSSSIKIYLDGVLQVEDTTSLVIDNLSSDLFIGTYGGGISQYAFDGKIDDIRIYNDALTDSLILDLYTEGGWPLPEDSVVIPPDTLVAYYPFNGNAMDSSGFENHGEVFGATLTEDRFGNPESAYNFNGDDFINTNTSFDFSYRSTSFWFLANDIIPDDGRSRIVLVQDSEELENGALAAVINGNDLVFNEGFGVSKFSVPNIQNGQWYHGVIVRKDSIAEYYLNGFRVVTVSSDSIGSSFGPNENLIIGAGRQLDKDFFSGVIDDIRIYNYALTDSSVLNLYAEGGWPLPEDTVIVPNDTLVAYYPFNGDVADSSGYGNHGEVFGATLTYDRFERFGFAYDLDGVDDFIRINNPAKLHSDKALSISLWAKGTSPDTSFVGLVAKTENQPFGVSIDDGDRLMFSISKDEIPLNLVIEGLTTNPEIWYQYVAVFKQNEYLRLYRDGVLLGSLTGTIPGSIDVNLDNILFGALSTESDTLFFEGAIDDIRIFNHYLSSEEVAALYSLEIQIPVSSEPVLELPDDFELYQNYPNPFNPSTTISFDLPKSEYVTLRVYDITGRLVSTLVDQQKSAGFYQIRFDASGLSSGVYIYQLETERFTQNRKFTLIK